MADTLDLLSLAHAKAAINMPASNPDHDTVLARHITAVSRIIDDACGPVVVRTVTAELHDGGGPCIYLNRYPVSSVTTVRELQGAGTIETLSAVAWGATGDGYFAQPWDRNPTLKSGEILRIDSGEVANWYRGTYNVEVTYIAGRYATTATVDARFADACGAILRRMWKREAGSWAQSSELFEDSIDAPSSGFFRAVRPLISEMLFDEMLTVGFA